MKHYIKNQLAVILIFSLLFLLYCNTSGRILESALTASNNTEAAAVWNERLIVLDAGHGGEDGGAIGFNGVLEKELNLDMAKALGVFLQFAGFEVVQTRTEDVMLYDRSIDYDGRKKVLDLAARKKIAEELLPDLFISIHMNAFPDSRYSGLTVYYSPNHPGSHDAAELIRTNTIHQLQPDNNRELKKAGSNIYLLHRLKCPAVLVECGFLSNGAECNKLTEQLYRHKLSLVMFDSLSSFFQE